MSEDNVEVQFGGDASGALASMSQVRFALQGLTAPIRGIRDNLGELADAFIAAFAADRMAEFVAKFAELGEQIERSSAMMGVSTKDVQELGFMARFTGGNAESMATAMERFEVSLAAAQNPTSRQAQALRALGLSAKELLSLPLPEQMNRFADAVSKFADGPGKTAAVGALNRGFVQMIPILDQGRAGLDKLRDTADTTGSVLTEKTVVALSNLDRSFVTLKGAVSGLAGTLVGDLAPAMTKFNNDLATTLGNISIAIQTHTLWEREMLSLATGARELGQAVANLGVMARDVFTLNWGEIAADRAAGLDKVAQIQKEGDARLLDMTKAAMDQYKKLLSGTDQGEGASKPQAPAMDVNQTDEVSAAQKNIDAQVKAWDEWLKKETAIYEESAKTFAITENQKFALTEAATEKTYKAELDLLQKEATIAGQTVAQRAAVLAKIKELEAKHDTDVVKLNAASIESMQKQWEGYFSTIQGAFNSNLRGLLAGTETWAQAFNKILGDLIIKFIEAQEQMLAKSVATEIAKTTAAQAGAAARETADSTASSGSIIVMLGNALKAIFAGAGQTAAGVSANVAPAVGPAAPAVGAAAGAAVIAEAVPLVPHAVGSWDVPGITPALLHPGEMVIPQTFAEGLRSNMGGGSGGDQYSITISAVDAQSVANLLQGQSGVIGQIVQKYVKNNPSAARSMQ